MAQPVWMSAVVFTYPRSLAFPAFRRRLALRIMRTFFGAATHAAADPLPIKGIHRILVCHVSHTLGNSLLLTPLLQELERVYPGAEIDIVSRSQVAGELYGRYFNVCRVFQLPAYGFSHPLTLLRHWRALRRGGYDLAIDTDPQSQTGRLLALQARARYTLGFDGPRKSGSMSHAVPLAAAPRRKGMQGVFLLRHALGVAGDVHLPYPLPDLALSDEERRLGSAALARLRPAWADPSRPVIGVFANATGRKRLEGPWWHAFLDQLGELEKHCDLVEILPAFGRSLLDHRYPTLFLSDLRKLGSALSGLDACVIGDCGVMHLTFATGTPVVALFVETDPDEWGVYGPDDHVLRVERDAPATAAREAARVLAARVLPGVATVMA